MTADVRHVGFTGSRTMPSAEQVEWLRDQLAILWAAGYRVLHHGDCTGGDATAHQVAKMLGYRVIIHPPDNPKHREWCQRDPDDWLLPERPYLTRNHDIVDASEFLLALPLGQEINHSGTWATIRYADSTGTPLAMLIRNETWPDPMTEFRMPDSWFEPPEPHSCERPDCGGDVCEQAALEAMEADRDDRNDSIRKGEWQ